MSTHPVKHHVRWNLESQECQQESGSVANDLSTSLGKLHANILSLPDIMKHVQKSVSLLKLENEALRKELSLAADKGRGLRSSAAVISKELDAPDATAPARLLKPQIPTEPDVVLPFCTQPEDEESAPVSRTAQVANAEDSERLEKRISTTVVKASSTTSNIGWINGAKETKQSMVALKSLRTKPLTTDTMVATSNSRIENNMGRAAKKDQAVRAMLFDIDMVKEQMKQNIAKPNFTVTRFYHKVGFCQQIARSHIFENITLAIIFMNTIWIAVDTEHNKAEVLLDAEPGFQIVEHFFCLYFFGEILIRFAAFESKRNCLRSGWFIFDSTLVVSMVLEDWVMTCILLASVQTGGGTGKGVQMIKNTAILRILRIMRLARLGRAVRLMRNSPEIMLIVKALIAATRCVVWTTVLLACLMFFFGVAFTQICRDTSLENTYFPSLTGSLHTLLIAGLFPDLEIISNDINQNNILLWLAFILYLMMTTITIMNMLIGVLVEVVKASASIERDAMDVAYVKEIFVSTLALQDVEDFTNISVCKEEFVIIVQDPDISKAMTKVGIDWFALIDLSDFIFMHGSVTFADLMEIVLQLRSSANVTVKDLVEVRKFLTFEITKMTADLTLLCNSIHTQAKESKLTAPRPTGFPTDAQGHSLVDDSCNDVFRIARLDSTETRGSELCLQDM